MREFVPDKYMPENQITFEQQKKALKYTIEKLEENGIDVVIINMPLNPTLSKRIPESTRKEISSFLSNTSAPYYDFESNYPPESFWDLNHMNMDGRNAFSTDAAKIILSEIGTNLNEKREEGDGKEGEERDFQSGISGENLQPAGIGEGLQAEWGGK